MSGAGDAKGGVRPMALQLENFRGWRGRHELALDSELILLVGANGAGKSSALNAIEWCLFGGEVAKKGSGIDERSEWEVAHRGAQGFVSVGLRLATADGEVHLERRRDIRAKKNDPDTLLLALPGEDVLEGEEVAEWMRWNSLPDWDTWKHAFCQHQELLRGRVTDAGQRSAQLGALLGLDAYQEMGERLKALKTRTLASTAQEELVGIEEELMRSLERPGLELRDLEDRLAKRGLDQSEVSEPTWEARAERILSEGRRMAALLELEAPLSATAAPTPDDVLRWANDWEPQVNRRRGELDNELGALRRDLNQLNAAIDGAAPAKRRWQDARSALTRWTEEHGTRDVLEQQLKSLQEERTRLQSEARAQDALRQLLQQAADALHGREGHDCPVCGHTDPTLAETLERKLSADAGPVAQALRRARRPRGAASRRSSTKLGELQAELEQAESAHRSLRKQLEAQLPADVADDFQALESLPRQWQQRCTALQDALDQLDSSLVRHREDAEVLDLLLKWRAARARADAATGDLSQLEAWDELQAAIDDAAGLACDVDALGAMLREAQEERSAEKVTEVNATLGAHFARISGRKEDEAARVTVKTTATRLTYQLVDAAGQVTTPVLNQAALNALSFAMLFAQAEERARRGEPQWLVLDDPGQSLDAEGLLGLANAVADIAQRVPVLLATYPGALVEELARSASGRARIFELTSASAAAGPVIREARS